MNNMKVQQPIDADVLMERLTAVNDDPYSVKYFYPLIVQRTRHELVGPGIVMCLVLSIGDFCKSRQLPSIAANVLLLSAEDYIKAMADNPDVQRDALEHYRKVRP